MPSISIILCIVAYIGVQDEVGYSGDFLYDRAVGDTIHWKEDKDLTKEIEIKKQRNKNTNRTRVIRKTRPTESFFNFFSPPQPPPPVDEEDEDEEDEDELEDIEERLELDYQIGEDIKERVRCYLFFVSDRIIIAS